MIVVTYSEARQNIAKLLDRSKLEEVRIRRRDGSEYTLKATEQPVTAGWPGV
jgi:hypothetical protein